MRVTDCLCPDCGEQEILYDDEHDVYYCDACDYEMTTVEAMELAGEDEED